MTVTDAGCMTDAGCRLIEASGGKVPVIKGDDGVLLPDSDKIVVMLEEEVPQPSMASSVPPEM